MRKQCPYRIILPEDYDRSRKDYSVLYLLHGLFGSGVNFLEQTDILAFEARRKFAVVLPEGENGWYTDGETDKYESSFLEEIIPAVEAKYNLGGARAVAGISMGGYGALKFAVRKPELFVFAGSMSGALDAAARTDSLPDEDWAMLGPSITKVFGNENSPLRRRNDLFLLVENFQPARASALPMIYLDCGKADSFLEANRRFARLLERKNIAFSYREHEGGHDWHYWNRQTRTVLAFAENCMKKAGALEIS